ncbi:glycoside hydrolase family 127 protein (plasmid) [Haloterrigena salifodinae]|uniref:Glycoside hydrolase family 127 protein n=1 Tax=Haloterrigena salifodinae TaxID=2675099 RepID=A0A8T8E8H6_9EURY|nr:beta-L-arabinofuranosidase domain-containing protein [Haloterrigena salifodinae]QRV17933.1 glycoside hydrolase family 127 protein [Haloterrigena salifodinae]
MSPRDAVSDGISLSEVTIDDDFWSPRRERNRDVTISYQYDQLEESGTLENFRRVADEESGGFQGMWFQDTDAYKWIEAASYVLSQREDPELEAKVDEVISLIADAQQPDGYLNTYFSLVEPENRWTNLHMMHELYCAGHLIEAAVAHYRATEKETLLEVAVDFADRVDDVFGNEVEGVPGHEEIELALLKLYRVTDETRYLELAKYFIDLRGKEDRLAWEIDNPETLGGAEYDDGEVISAARDVFTHEDGTYDRRYAQAHEPLRDQETVEGHSVRAMYLFAAATDLAIEMDEDELIESLERLWTNMTTKRMYVTGGLGPEEAHEGFTTDYDLRNDAYAETCAAIGSVYWNQRLFELTGEAKYADLIERTLYNGFLAGVSLDGTEFFYENPLESDGDHHRKGWFTCACCPPNAARLLASLGEYVYSQRGSALYVNQYLGGSVETTVDGATVELSQDSFLPWSGEVTIDVDAEGASVPLRLRIPEWAESSTVTVNGESLDAPAEGYLEVEREWDDDRIELTFEQAVTRLEAHPAVAADAGRVALKRGPLVYCLEAVDNDRPLQQYEDPEPTSTTHRPDLLEGVTVIEGEASVPDRQGWDGELYRPADETARERTEFTAVPYYAWDNREPGAMRVWLRS